MRTKTGWLVGILTTGLALTPRPGWSQGIGPADSPIVPLPLYHDRPEKGGVYFGAEYMFMRQTNPIKSQIIAVRGLVDTDGSLQSARNFLQPFDIDPTTGIVLTRPTTNPNTGQPIRVPVPAPAVIPGAFFGSGATALDAEQVAGPGSYQSGFRVTMGYRFSDGFTLEASWRHLAEVRYNAVASLIPGNFNIGRDGEDQFLFSPVHNFPPEFAGPSNKMAIIAPQGVGGTGRNQAVSGSIILTPFPSPPTSQPVTAFSALAQASSNGPLVLPQPAYGIWNGATIMSIDFVQRYDDYELIGRMPFYQDDCSRWYGLCGLRHVGMWERFKWRSVSLQSISQPSSATLTLPTLVTSSLSINVTQTGTPTVILSPPQPLQAINQFLTVATSNTAVPATAGADDVAIYTNIVSNRMYGPVVGCGSEWYSGWGMAFSLDLRAALHVDVVKERARYERQDKYVSHKRSRSEYVLVPELDALANLWWSPAEGIELKVGYDFMSFFNTISSPRPVDFNYGAVAPAWEKGTYRFIDGFHAGIGLIF